MGAERIPAWKRLGLKLKFAGQDATIAQSNGGVEKRKQNGSVHGMDESETKLHQPKKRRTEIETSEKQTEEDVQDHFRDPANASLPKRKKSVSFTADTKAEDGDSAQTIQLWVPDSPGSTPKKPSNALDSSQPEEFVGKPKRTKRTKERKDLSNKQPRKATAALSYLDQYHLQRSDWKFNKNHETWILKNALSTDHISLGRNLALSSYLRGLKSQGARERLVAQSREALKPEESNKEEDDNVRKRMQRLLETKEDDHNDNPELFDWIKDVDRARLILLSLGESSQKPREQPSRTGRPVPRTKKNKSRTTRIDIDSSSSSGTSDEDSESEDSDSNKVEWSAGRQAVRTIPAKATTEESSASSSDSDSSSSEAVNDTTSGDDSGSD